MKTIYSGGKAAKYQHDSYGVKISPTATSTEKISLSPPALDFSSARFAIFARELFISPVFHPETATSSPSPIFSA